MAVCKAVKDAARENNDLYRVEPAHPRKKLTMVLPLGPSVNHMYLRRGGLNKRARDYTIQARALIAQSVEEQNWNSQEDGTWYYLDMLVYMPDRRIRDTHNLLKLLLDCVQPEVGINDYYILPRIVGAELDLENPRIVMTLRPQNKKDRIKIKAWFKE